MNIFEKRRTLAALRDQIEGLEKEIARAVALCGQKGHQWGDTISDPRSEPDYVFTGYEGHGSDPIPKMERTRDKVIPRWKRVCENCGHIQYTEKRKVATTIPDFS